MSAPVRPQLTPSRFSQVRESHGPGRTWSGLLLVACVSFGALPAFGERALPRPLPEHPGNVFLAGECIAVPVPSGESGTGAPWQVTDYAGAVVTDCIATNGQAVLGVLPAGYYELHRLSNGAPIRPKVTLAAVPPLKAPTPVTSPIGVDVGLAERFSSNQYAAVANLCTLAGVNWVRDRFSWRSLQPVPGPLSPPGKYDEAVRAQAAAGLKVLQVFNDSPSWTGTNWRRFPADLREASRFVQAMAKRWEGDVQAFEPWNEADIPVFGGHSGTELASYQKACYFGLREGNPKVLVCQNAFGSPHPRVLNDFMANEVAPYFDTFNYHHYCWPEEYPAVYAAFRPAAAGKPMWATEFCVPVTWPPENDADREPSDAELRAQAERIPKLFASCLYQGADVAFYFMLPHYIEVRSVYGVLHPDLTPRPGFLALAAMGRLLADAKPLGRISDGPQVRAIAFGARPDGQESDVLVAWSEGADSVLQLPEPPWSVYDVIGRKQTNTATATLKLSASPVIAVFAKASLKRLKLEAPPQATTIEARQPCPVVLQVLLPKEKLVESLSAYACSSTNTNVCPVAVYNFGKTRAEGTFKVTVPPGWNAEFVRRVQLEPGERRELMLKVDCRGGMLSPAETVRVQGDFGQMGQAVVAFRLTPQPFVIKTVPVLGIQGASRPERWQPVAAPGGQARISSEGDGLLTVQAQFAPGENNWIYPALTLAAAERAPVGTLAFAATLRSVEGQAHFRLLLQEQNQSIYFADFYPNPNPGETVEAVAVLTNALFGEGWSPPDDNGKLDPEKISALRIGCNTTNKSAKFSLKNVHWLLGGGK